MFWGEFHIFLPIWKFVEKIGYNNMFCYEMAKGKSAGRQYKRVKVKGGKHSRSSRKDEDGKPFPAFGLPGFNLLFFPLLNTLPCKHLQSGRLLSLLPTHFEKDI